MTALQSRMQESLRSRAERQILRSLDPATLVSASSSTHPLVDFSSNDYLSLARSRLLRSRLLDALSSLPSPYGPPSSRLLDGNSSIHLDLERQLQVFFKSEAALLFNSGFDANVGLWTCLPSPDDYILYDALIHASTHDGMRSSRIPVWNRRSFKHNDVEDLRRTLHQLLAEDEGVRAGNKSVWIAVETLYSMDGDLSPLASIVEAVEQILHRGNGHFVVDEAHSTGLYGEQGRGIVSALGLEDRIEVRVHTFGKSMACSGAVVLCKSLLRSYLINYARPLIYSTVMPHMNVLAISNSFKMLSDGHGDEAAARVHALSSLLVQQLSTFLTPTSFPIALPTIPRPPSTFHPTTTPIIPLLTLNPRALSSYLISRGFLVRPISYPTVPKAEARVRVCLHAENTREEVVELAGVVREWIERGEYGELARL